MTKEQYKRAIEIYNRLENLNDTKKNIENTKKHRLWYGYNNGEFGSSWGLAPEWAMRNIADILDKHDLMIRQEIDDEIARLKKEIETL